MSYEGHEVYLCPRGHLTGLTVGYTDLFGGKCRLCAGPLDLVMGVDETNGTPYYLRGYLEEIERDDSEYLCPTCKHPLGGYSAGVARYQYVELEWTCHDGNYIFNRGTGPSVRLHGWHED